MAVAGRATPRCASPSSSTAAPTSSASAAQLAERGIGDALVRDGDRLGIFTTTNLRDALLPADAARPNSRCARSPTFEPLSVSARRRALRRADPDAAPPHPPRDGARRRRDRRRPQPARPDGLRRQPLAPDRAAGRRRPTDVAELAAAARQIDGLIRVLHEDGVRIEVIAGLVGGLNRQIFQRLWTLLAPEELRANSCLVVMGSEGRGEQIVKTDQDNALILRDGFAFAGPRGGDRGLHRRADRLRLSALPGRHHAEPPALVPAARRLPRHAARLDPRQPTRRAR